MPKLVQAFPKLHQHASGKAFVKVDGQQVYLGPYGDPATRAAYDRFIAGPTAACHRSRSTLSRACSPSTRNSAEHRQASTSNG